MFFPSEVNSGEAVDTGDWLPSLGKLAEANLTPSYVPKPLGLEPELCDEKSFQLTPAHDPHDMHTYTHTRTHLHSLLPTRRSFPEPQVGLCGHFAFLSNVARLEKSLSVCVCVGLVSGQPKSAPLFLGVHIPILRSQRAKCRGSLWCCLSSQSCPMVSRALRVATIFNQPTHQRRIHRHKLHILAQAKAHRQAKA